MLSKETMKRALLRCLEAGLGGAAVAFTIIPINLEDPKRYGFALLIGMGTGFLAGVKKAIKGYKQYDKKTKKPTK